MLLGTEVDLEQACSDADIPHHFELEGPELHAKPAWPQSPYVNPNQPSL